MKRQELATFVNPLFGVYGRMTVRQVYYQLASKQLIENSTKSYKAYDSLLTRCRENGQIDPAMFIDGSRPQENFNRYGFTSLEDYVVRETLPGADVVRVARTPEHVEEYRLPPIPTKPGDTRQPGFVSKHGDAAVELDALPPDALVGLAQRAVDQYIDRDQVAHVAELEAVKQELWTGMLQRLEATL